MNLEHSQEVARLRAEASSFRAWAEADAKKHPTRSGEWECDYPHWPRAYATVGEFLHRVVLGDVPREVLTDLLYLLARDNECQHVARCIAPLPVDSVIFLAEQCADSGEPDARWQLAVRLGGIPSGPEAHRIEGVLLAFMRDEDEYVRRRSLTALALRGSPATERLALAAWEERHDAQQWTRMNALEALDRVKSAHLAGLLRDAAADPRPHLSAFARNMLSGKPGWSPTVA
jgi:HEAT repeat protein